MLLSDSWDIVKSQRNKLAILSMFEGVMPKWYKLNNIANSNMKMSDKYGISFREFNRDGYRFLEETIGDICFRKNSENKDYSLILELPPYDEFRYYFGARIANQIMFDDKNVGLAVLIFEQLSELKKSLDVSFLLKPHMSYIGVVGEGVDNSFFEDALIAQQIFLNVLYENGIKYLDIILNERGDVKKDEVVDYMDYCFSNVMQAYKVFEKYEPFKIFNMQNYTFSLDDVIINSGLSNVNENFREYFNSSLSEYDSSIMSARLLFELFKLAPKLISESNKRNEVLEVVNRLFDNGASVGLYNDPIQAFSLRLVTGNDFNNISLASYSQEMQEDLRGFIESGELGTDIKHKLALLESVKSSSEIINVDIDDKESVIEDLEKYIPQLEFYTEDAIYKRVNDKLEEIEEGGVAKVIAIFGSTAVFEKYKNATKMKFEFNFDKDMPSETSLKKLGEFIDGKINYNLFAQEIARSFFKVPNTLKVNSIIKDMRLKLEESGDVKGVEDLKTFYFNRERKNKKKDIDRLSGADILNKKVSAFSVNVSINEVEKKGFNILNEIDFLKIVYRLNQVVHAKKIDSANKILETLKLKVLIKDDNKGNANRVVKGRV